MVAMQYLEDGSIMNVCFLIKQNLIKLEKIVLPFLQQIRYSMPQDSSFFSSFGLKEENIKPNSNITIATIADIKETAKSISFFTTDWTIAKTIIAIDKLISPFHTSFKPFNQSIVRYYNT